MSRPNVSSLGTLSSLSKMGSQAASGSLAAVGGVGAVHNAGGGGGGSHHSSSPSRVAGAQSDAQTRHVIGSHHHEFLAFSLPSTGVYLRLVDSACGHLMSLLSRCRFKEIPLDLLRHRWDGGVAGEDSISLAKRSRGEFGGVLPGTTRKWKSFSGLTFDWTLGECVASGIVELFDTGSVGKGIRARSR